MKKILVIGDSSRDVFVYCDAVRLCPDVPVPVLNILDQQENPGMAKNVYRNIKNLVSDCDMVTNNNWYDITKTRYVHKNSNHMFFRVDTTQSIPRIDTSTIDYDYDAIVISDYDKGFLTEDDINEICFKHSNVFLDTKKILGTWAQHAKYIKINDYEYQNSKPYMSPELKNKIIHTMGSDGCEYKDVIYPVNRVDVKDVSGAGDSFISGLVVKYYETGDIIQSIKFANECASEVVKHRGVTTI
jgi:D-beta-D-heptose 7-phosphate kinase/D-beta-D-heptose 1-phosphate adenosyltransferase